MADEEAYVLSAADKDFLKVLYQQYANKLGNRQIGISRTLEDTQQNTDIYIARTPTAGIPALAENNTGTGSGITDDTPGEATCDIYTINLADRVTRLKPITGLAKKVYNISTSVIAGDSWILVTKEKFGFWIAVNPGGGTGGGGSGDTVTGGTPDVATLSHITSCGTDGLIWDEYNLMVFIYVNGVKTYCGFEYV